VVDAILSHTLASSAISQASKPSNQPARWPAAARGCADPAALKRPPDGEGASIDIEPGCLRRRLDLGFTVERV